MYLRRCSSLGLRCSYKRRSVHWGPCLWLAKARRLHSPTGSKHGWAAIHATLQHWQQTVTNLKRRIISLLRNPRHHAAMPQVRPEAQRGTKHCHVNHMSSCDPCVSPTYNLFIFCVCARLHFPRLAYEARPNRTIVARSVIIVADTAQQQTSQPIVAIALNFIV